MTRAARGMSERQGARCAAQWKSGKLSIGKPVAFTARAVLDSSFIGKLSAPLRSRVCGAFFRGRCWLGDFGQALRLRGAFGRIAHSTRVTPSDAVGAQVANSATEFQEGRPSAPAAHLCERRCSKTKDFRRVSGRKAFDSLWHHLRSLTWSVVATD